MKTLLNRHALWLAAGLIAVCLPLCAQTNKPSGAMIQFDNPDYAFGRVASGERVNHTYVVSNTGDATLIITNVHPSCGCTTAGQWTREIPPGKSGTIPIQFNSAHYSTAVFKTIDVYSSAVNQPHATLRLTGQVWQPIEIRPATAYIVVSPDEAKAPISTVHIINNGDAPIQLSDVQPSSGKFTAELKELKPGREFELLIKAMPPFEPGNTPGSISIKTSLPAMPHLTVTAIASVRESIQISPPTVRLNPTSDHWATNDVFISNFDYPGFELSNPTSTDNRLVITLQRMHPNRGLYNVWIAVPPGYRQTPNQVVEVTVKTNHPHHPVIRIPVVQLPAAYSPLRGPATALDKHS